MAAPHAKIPEDIIYAVVTQVGDAGELPTLRSCNATSKAFRFVAQRYLFDTITIVINSNKERVIARLRNILEVFLASPSAALMVKTLFVGFISGSPSGIPESCPLLEMMPNIEWLLLFSVEQNDSLTWRRVPSWNRFDLNLRKEIEQLLRRDSLVHLCVRNIDAFPLSILRVCRGNLQTLRLTNLGRQEEENFVADAGSWLHTTNPPSLKHCDITYYLNQNVNPVLKELLQYPLSGVCDLKIHCRHLDTSLMQQLVNRVSPSLKTLDLSVVDGLGTITLSQATKLSELSLDCDQVATSKAISSILQVLNTIQRTHTLKVLTLRIGVVALDVDNLAELSHELTSSPKFGGCLIHLYTGVYHRVQEDFDKVLATHMWSLVQRPQTSIYKERSGRVDLEAVRARVRNDVN